MLSDLSTPLLDAVATPVAVVDLTGSVIYGNSAFMRTLGDRAGDWLASAAGSRGGEVGWLASFLKDRHSGRAVDVEFDGRTYNIQCLGASLGTDAIGLSFDDVTTQREAEQARSDFTSMVVHDLRGPLSGIQGTIDYVLGEESLGEVQQQLLEEASREAERMMALIGEILDFSKIESGNFAVEAEQVALAQVLRRAVVSLQTVAQREGILLLSAHGPELPAVSGSMEKLTQAIINLLSNSLKFTPKRGLISVGAQVVKDGGIQPALIVTVTDSGVGIKSAERDQIFEKYQQSGNRSLRGGSGTGLGLYIVKQVVEAHGGEVAVASVGGLGTSMVLRLPVRAAVTA